MDYTLMHLAQAKAETHKRNECAMNYIARNKRNENLEMFLAALCIPFSIMALYFVCVMF